MIYDIYDINTFLNLAFNSISTIASAIIGSLNISVRDTIYNINKYK